MFDIEKQKQEKIAFQKAVRQKSKTSPLLIIEAITGSGKGLAGLECIEEDNSGIKWLILVPETLHIVNYQDDIKKHDKEHVYDKIEDIICYASLHKWSGEKVNILASECHHISEEKLAILKTIKFQKFIGDSATISKEIKDRLKQLGKFDYFKLSAESAISRGIIPESKIYLIEVELDHKIRRNKAKLGQKTFMLTDKEYIEHIEKNIEYWKKRLLEKKEVWVPRKLNSLGTERIQFFAKCKTDAAKRLLQHLDNKRVVCFTGSTDQCSELGGLNAVYGERGKKTNANVLNSFNKKEINKIFFYKMGREGLNLEGIEAGVIVQVGTGNDENLSFIQMHGRTNRSLTPELYLFCIKGTTDEKFINKALDGKKAIKLCV